jgi:hypothetical protein
MNIGIKFTTLPHSATCSELIGLFDSIAEDISLAAAEHDPAAKNLVLPERSRCLGPLSESLPMEARQAHLYPSRIERSVPYDEQRDWFRRPGCMAAVYSWHSRRHSSNSDRRRRSSFRPRDNSRSRQGARRAAPRKPDHGGRCQGCWETPRWARTTVAEPGMVGLRDVSQASTVVGVFRRGVLQNRRRVLTNSEEDDDPSSP